MRWHRGLSYGLVAGAIGATLLLWTRLSYGPLFWSALIWSAVLIGLHFISSRPGGRHWLIYVAAAVLGIGIAEGWLCWRRYAAVVAQFQDVTYEGVWKDWGRGDFLKFLVTPDPLGFRPRPGTVAIDRKKYRNAVVYDVRYTIDDRGLRIGPPTAPETRGCVLFFGDSFLFGIGVKDEETTAYQLGLITAGQYQVYNFAFTAYGPHQLLSQLRSGVIRRIAACPRGKPVYVVHELLAKNVSRVFGDMGPRYTMSRSGELVLRGQLHDGEFIAGDRVYLPEAIASVARKVQLYELTLGERRRPTQFDVQRFIAVLSAARRELRAEFPAAKLFTAVWDDFEDGDGTMIARRQALIESLARSGIEAIGVDRILPDYDRDPLRFGLGQEKHPTAEAHRLFAAYLAKEFIAAETVAGSSD